MDRRRFIHIMATSTAAVGLYSSLKAIPLSPSLQPVIWRGYVLGTQGQFTLYTDKPKQTKAILDLCFAEIRRLESIFSLYQSNSEIRQLNQNGRLSHPSSEWQSLFQSIDAAYQLTDGNFDPTIQPLWKLYENYFRENPDANIGPSEHQIESCLKLVDWTNVEYSKDQITLKKRGMALTLNGIAQGFITDRISELLMENGFNQVLVELGETRALGLHPTGRRWNIELKNPTLSTQPHTIIPLSNNALATSGGYGSPFSKDGKVHHLLHPKFGHSKTQWQQISVIAPTATQADALSTGLIFADQKKVEKVQSILPQIKIHFV